MKDSDMIKSSREGMVSLCVVRAEEGGCGIGEQGRAL